MRFTACVIALTITASGCGGSTKATAPAVARAASTEQRPDFGQGITENRIEAALKTIGLIRADQSPACFTRDTVEVWPKGEPVTSIGMNFKIRTPAEIQTAVDTFAELVRVIGDPQERESASHWFRIYIALKMAERDAYQQMKLDAMSYPPIICESVRLRSFRIVATAATNRHDDVNIAFFPGPNDEFSLRRGY